MRPNILYLVIAFFILACSSQDRQEENLVVENRPEAAIVPKDTIGVNDRIIAYATFRSERNEIPPDGTYRFDIAFAEWQGKSMGEGVTVAIAGDSIKVIYEGDGSLTNTKKGTMMDQGLIMKHKSGDWIIGTRPEDKEMEEVGGCTGGPAIIDFKHKRYWMC
ncbi:hypothetical protein [Flavilitoribacter nigricans]|uniref:Uncharacterized protein n=1 Tax=Flavilitoribacter nigricans (strain ATCC 23147 / DSM 23189 / NBRC 102662 / NCIMB 1420 / SS-2) TaxID=1122177 RepID=A0A2D0NEQ3_FLAN2|nr:hypothetical protein [Flavilitoribacter nigricans]PHN06994.1 hypothetical protein CRP01_08520 [Flavilitoribacter nigricans DSM 23189 = NBRC 102662]